MILFLIPFVRGIWVGWMIGQVSKNQSLTENLINWKTSSTEYILRLGGKKSRNLFPLLPELNCKEWFAPWSILNFTQQRPQEIVRPNHGSVLEIINKIAVCLFVYWKVYQNKLASSVDAIAVSKIWKHHRPTHWLADLPTRVGAKRCYRI